MTVSLMIRDKILTLNGQSAETKWHSMFADFSKFIITVSGDSGGWDGDLQLYPIANSSPIPEAFIQNLQ